MTRTLAALALALALPLSLAACSAAPAPSLPRAAHTSPAAFAFDTSTLPSADFAGVIPRLVGPPAGVIPETVRAVTQPVVLYAAPSRGAEPVAVLGTEAWAGAPLVVPVTETRGAWSLVLTPSRIALPSQNGGVAPAQSAAWVRMADLGAGHTPNIVTISLSGSRLVSPWTGSVSAGYGAPGTETPVGVAFVLGVAVPTDEYPEGYVVTSLHSAAQDSPWSEGGQTTERDGGVIGIHSTPGANSGPVSHGCIRLSHEAALALVQGVQPGDVVVVTP